MTVGLRRSLPSIKEWNGRTEVSHVNHLLGPGGFSVAPHAVVQLQIVPRPITDRLTAADRWSFSIEEIDGVVPRGATCPYWNTTSTILVYSSIFAVLAYSAFTSIAINAYDCIMSELCSTVDLQPVPLPRRSLTLDVYKLPVSPLVGLPQYRGPSAPSVLFHLRECVFFESFRWGGCECSEYLVSAFL